MKLLTALQNVKKDEPHWVSLAPLCEALGISEPWTNDFDDRLKGYFLKKWYCTDTWVGIQAIYLDDFLVAMTYQSARKNDPEVHFVSQATANKLRKVLTSHEPVKLIPKNEEIEPTYRIDYVNSLLDKEGYYKGKPVTVVRKPGLRSYGAKTITVDDGTSRFDILVEELEIPINADISLKDLCSG